MAKTLLALVALTAVTVVEHNGIKYGPGLPDGADFDASDAEANALLQVKAAKLRGDKDPVVVTQADPNAANAALEQARAASEAAADAQAQADAAAQAAADAQAKADADAAAVADARAKLDADMKAFADAQAAAGAQAVAGTKKK